MTAVVLDREAESGVLLEQTQVTVGTEFLCKNPVTHPPYEIHVYSDFLNPSTLL